MTIPTALYLSSATQASATAQRSPAWPRAAHQKAHPADTGLPVMNSIDRLFDLSRPNRDILGTLHSLQGDELDEFLKLTAYLLQQGIVGIETLEVRGRPYQSFISNRIAAPQLHGARPYRRPIDLGA